MAGGLYDVTSCLTAWSHVPSGGLCAWSHVPSWGDVPTGGGGLPTGGGASAYRGGEGLCTGGGGLPMGGGWAEPPLKLQKRVVRILLECFLVVFMRIPSFLQKLDLANASTTFV